jgi:hypothetical protein
MSLHRSAAIRRSLGQSLRCWVVNMSESTPVSSRLRFDHRTLVGNAVGTDFEQFTLESFQRSEPRLTLVSSLSTSKDGAIDLSTDDENRCIVECKFIGEESKSSALDRWRPVENTLRENLLRLAENEDGGEIQYGPWLSARRPVRQYRFCVSSPCGSVRNRDTLKGRIETFLYDLSTEHDRLRHLADVKVRVFFWDDFYQILVSHPVLRYRWFGGLPPGLSLISEAGFESGSFREFLSGTYLPYFSRVQFAASEGQRLEQSEDDWTSLADQGRSLLIYGPGGSGKTRLALEICRRLSGRDWLALEVGSKAQSSAIETVLRSHSAPARVVLFIDYGETAQRLGEMSTLAHTAFERTGHHVVLVVTCRSSSWQSVTDELASLEPAMVAVGSLSEVGIEGRYAAWVVRRILDHFEVPSAYNVAGVCDNLPVLAAFASFLYLREPTAFDAQFGNLLELTDFRSWVRRRVINLLEGASNKPGTLIKLSELFMALPAPVSDYSNPKNEMSLLLETLVADRWVEVDGSYYSAAHDVFADGIVADYLFGLPGLATERLRGLLFLAVENDSLLKALSATNRLATYSEFSSIDGLGIVERLIEMSPGPVLDVAWAIVAGRLLDEAEKIMLLSRHGQLRARIAETSFLDGHVSYLAEWASRLPRDAPAYGHAKVALPSLLGQAVGRFTATNMVLRRAYSFDPAVYKDLVIHRLAAEVELEASHFLIVALLRLEDTIEPLNRFISAWFNKNDGSLAASFVLSAWLYRHPIGSDIAPFLFPWLEKFYDTEASSYVLTAWLRSGGDSAVVRKYVLAGLPHYGKLVSAAKLYEAWHRSSGDPADIRGEVANWLGLHKMNVEAARIYGSMPLDTAEVSNERNDVSFWLINNQRESLAGKPLVNWLVCGGDPEFIRHDAQIWLSIHAERKDARLLLSVWLKRGGAPSTIANELPRWLELHGSTEEAGYLMGEWLHHGGSLDRVECHLENWLDCPRDASAVGFLLGAWLEHSQAEVVRERCVRWFAEHWNKEESAPLTKALSSLLCLDIDTAILIARWANRFYQTPEAISRLSRMFHRSYVVSSRFGELINLVLCATWKTLDYHASAADYTKYDKLAGGMLLSNLCGTVGQHELVQTKLDLIVLYSVIYASLFTADSELRYRPEIVMAFVRALDRVPLDIKENDKVLVPFLNWIMARADDINYKGVHNLLKRHGIEIPVRRSELPLHPWATTI